MEFCDMGDLSEYYKKHYPERVPLAHQVHFMYQVISKDKKEKNRHALSVSAEDQISNLFMSRKLLTLINYFKIFVDLQLCYSLAQFVSSNNSSRHQTRQCNVV